ncbi:ADAMTS-like protein 4 [Nothoprocta perdicaria]|uniref:ADAMTS-like protein 4 n=1 Tax=Nothoprocta perdicaria TaxID=30464 RepID=UPI000E1B658A|nr:ADAMTS-like protein 4 [Nothoprocta perdicaria]
MGGPPQPPSPPASPWLPPGGILEPPQNVPAVGPGPLCAGESHQLRACLLQSCPPGQPSLPALQCAALDEREFLGRRFRWEPFLDAADGCGAARGARGCELNCRPVGHRFYVRHAEPLNDGAPCAGGICAHGRCLLPRCDGVLASGAVPAASCHLHAGNFSGRPDSPGYHKVLEIPPGATRLRVAQLGPSRNHLVLRSPTGDPLLNGGGVAGPPGHYEAAGTIFEYRRAGPGAPETLSAPGPTTEPLDVYVLFQQDNPGFTWQFFLATDGPDAAPTQPGPVSTVAPDAGPVAPVTPSASEAAPPPVAGASGREVPLQHHNRGHRDSDSGGDHGQGYGYDRDLNHNRGHNHSHDHDHDHSWRAGAWSPCSGSCGVGTQQRDVRCHLRGHPAPAARCASRLPPAATRSCPLPACGRWEVQSPWSTCSVPCGQGQRSRAVRCVSTQGPMHSEAACPPPRPPARQPCNMGPCARLWLHSDWSDTCPLVCGPGEQRRTVLCLAGPSPGACEGPRPPATRPCHQMPCGHAHHWFTGPWSPCSAECGPGEQHRDVLCVGRRGARVAVAATAACEGQPRPPGLQPCTGTICRPRWFVSTWSACSRSCQGGVQARAVHCLAPNQTLSTQCPPRLRPARQRPCNDRPCAHGELLDALAPPI